MDNWQYFTVDNRRYRYGLRNGAFAAELESCVDGKVRWMEVQAHFPAARWLHAIWIAATPTSATSEREGRLVEAALVEMSEKITDRYRLALKRSSYKQPPLTGKVLDSQFAAIRAEVLAALDTPASGGGEGVR